MRSPLRVSLLVPAGIGIAIAWAAAPQTRNSAEERSPSFDSAIKLMTTAAHRPSPDILVSPAAAAAPSIAFALFWEESATEERPPPDTTALPPAPSSPGPYSLTLASPASSSIVSSATAAGEGAAAPRMSGRRALKKAREALLADNLAEALRNYEIALDKDPGGANLAEALFGAGLLRLLPNRGPGDVALGRKRLEEFEKLFPDHRYLAGAKVALGLQEESNAIREEKGRLREDLDKQRESCASERNAMNGRLEAAETQSRTYVQAAASQVQRIEALEAQLAESNKTLANLRAKSEAQEKALKEKDRTVWKLKRALVKQRTPAAPQLPK